MYQETEQGVCKPVLGALGVASVFLTLVGHLVFSPNPSLLRTPDRADTDQAPLVDQAQQIAQLPTGRLVPEPEPALEVDETIVSLPVEVPISSRETPGDISVARQVPQSELAPRSDETVVGPLVEGPVLPRETASDVLVAGQTPSAELAPQPEQATKADETIVAVPVERPLLSQKADSSQEPGSDVSVADVRPGPDMIPLADSVDGESPAVAVADPTPAVIVPQKLSHHDRKLLRKAEHLEKRKNRLLAHSRPVAGR